MKLVIDILLFILALTAMFFIIYIWLYGQYEEFNIDELNPIGIDLNLKNEVDEIPQFFNVKIIKCTNQFAWYADIPKIKDVEIINGKEVNRESEKIFMVEIVDQKWHKINYHNPNIKYDACYRTKDDIVGKNVKGFIHLSDAEIIKNVCDGKCT